MAEREDSNKLYLDELQFHNSFIAQTKHVYDFALKANYSQVIFAKMSCIEFPFIHNTTETGMENRNGYGYGYWYEYMQKMPEM